MSVVRNILPIRTYTLCNEPYEHRKISFFASIEYDVANRFGNKKSKPKSRGNTVSSGIKIEPLQNMHLGDVRFGETNDYWQVGVF